MSKFNFNIDVIDNESSGLSKNTYNSKTQFDSYNASKCIDLGLPSGNLWCEYNVGVNPNELSLPANWYGGFYAWGEIEAGKDEYSWNNYDFGNDASSMTKYCTLNGKNYWGGEGEPDRKTTLESIDDIATITLGKKFHIPTKKDFEELFRCTSMYWVTKYLGVEVFGSIFKSNKNDNEIFLPAGGSYFDKTHTWETHTGSYWTSSLALNSCFSAYSCNFSVSADGEIRRDDRCHGLLIRPIMKI